MKWITLILLFLLTACSSVKTTNSNQRSVDNEQLANVDLELSEAAQKENEAIIQPNEETIRLGTKGGDVYVQGDEHGTQSALEKIKRLKIGLSLGPGLYRTISYVSMLKQLEKARLVPSVITGTEFGAIVAAMYASGMTPESIEWNFYKYFKEKSNRKVFSDDWIEDIDKHLISKIKIKNIEEAKKKLFLTLYSPKTKKTHFFEKGNLRQILLLNFKIFDPEEPNVAYTTAFEKEIFNSNLLKHFGSEVTIAADVLGPKHELIDTNEQVSSLYSKAFTLLKKEKRTYDFFSEIPVSHTALDSTKDGPEVLLKSKQFFDTQSVIIKKSLIQKYSQLYKTAE